MDYKPIDILQLKQMQAIIEVAVSKIAVDCGLRKPYLSLNQAYKKYGRKTVNRWIAEKRITVIRDGTGTSKCRIKREEIELVAATSNRDSWFEHHK